MTVGDGPRTPGRDDSSSIGRSIVARRRRSTEFAIRRRSRSQLVRERRRRTVVRAPWTTSSAGGAATSRSPIRRPSPLGGATATPADGDRHCRRSCGPVGLGGPASAARRRCARQAAGSSGRVRSPVAGLAGSSPGLAGEEAQHAPSASRCPRSGRAGRSTARSRAPGRPPTTGTRERRRREQRQDVVGAVARRPVAVAVEPLVARQQPIERGHQVVVGPGAELDDHEPGRRVRARTRTAGRRRRPSLGREPRRTRRVRSYEPAAASRVRTVSSRVSTGRCSGARPGAARARPRGRRLVARRLAGGEARGAPLEQPDRRCCSSGSGACRRARRCPTAPRPGPASGARRGRARRRRPAAPPRRSG